MNDTELIHYGVKGVRWGVRKARRKEVAALRSASKAVGDSRRKELLSKAEQHHKEADRIREAHAKAKAEKKNMRLRPDGSITEITKAERTARGEKIAKGVAFGVGSVATVVALAPAVVLGHTYVKMVLDT